MASVRNFGLVARLRSKASSHVIRYRDGRVRRSGRGLSIEVMSPISRDVVFADDTAWDFLAFDRGRRVPVRPAARPFNLAVG